MVSAAAPLSSSMTLLKYSSSMFVLFSSTIISSYSIMISSAATAGSSMSTSTSYSMPSISISYSELDPGIYYFSDFYKAGAFISAPCSDFGD